MKNLITLLVIFSFGCEDYRETKYEEPCRDSAQLLATTAGSPNGFECSNKKHKMHIEVATDPTTEEAAAVAFCKCVD